MGERSLPPSRVSMLMLRLPKRHQGTMRTSSRGDAPGLGRGARRATGSHAYV